MMMHNRTMEMYPVGTVKRVEAARIVGAEEDTRGIWPARLARDSVFPFSYLLVKRVFQVGNDKIAICYPSCDVGKDGLTFSVDGYFAVVSVVDLVELTSGLACTFWHNDVPYGDSIDYIVKLQTFRVWDEFLHKDCLWDGLMVRGIMQGEPPAWWSMVHEAIGMGDLLFVSPYREYTNGERRVSVCKAVMMMTPEAVVAIGNTRYVASDDKVKDALESGARVLGELMAQITQACDTGADA